MINIEIWYDDIYLIIFIFDENFLKKSLKFENEYFVSNVCVYLTKSYGILNLLSAREVGSSYVFGLDQGK